MKRHLHFSDEGLILRKSSSKDNDKRVVILTKNHGKKNLTAFGVRKLTSKRLSHLESGSVIKFTWSESGDFVTLGETELLFAHSKIKEEKELLDMMYTILHIVNKLTREDEPSTGVYTLTLEYLRKIYSGGVSNEELAEYVSRLLVQEGFISVSESKKAGFDSFAFAEGLIGEKLGFM